MLFNVISKSSEYTFERCLKNAVGGGNANYYQQEAALILKLEMYQLCLFASFMTGWFSSGGTSLINSTNGGYYSSY